MSLSPDAGPEGREDCWTHYSSVSLSPGRIPVPGPDIIHQRQWISTISFFLVKFTLVKCSMGISSHKYEWNRATGSQRFEKYCIIALIFFFSGEGYKEFREWKYRKRGNTYEPQALTCSTYPAPWNIFEEPARPSQKFERICWSLGSNKNFDKEKIVSNIK